MANLFEGIWDGLKSATMQPIESVKDLAKGDFKEAFEHIRSMPGDQERANSKVLNSMGVGGWVGDNPIAIPAAIMGGVMGGSALAGAGSSAASAIPSSTAAFNAPAGYAGSLGSGSGWLGASSESGLASAAANTPWYKDVGMWGDALDVASQAANLVLNRDGGGATTSISSGSASRGFKGVQKDTSLQGGLSQQHFGNQFGTAAQVPDDNYANIKLANVLR